MSKAQVFPEEVDDPAEPEVADAAEHASLGGESVPQTATPPPPHAGLSMHDDALPLGHINENDDIDIERQDEDRRS